MTSESSAWSRGIPGSDLLPPPAAAAHPEIVPPDPLNSVRWAEHDYPHPLARWNRHPEIEIHLIRRGTGRYIVGEGVGSFGPGHVAVVGPHLPHDWISDLLPGEVIAGRDALVQVHPDWLAGAGGLIPELDEVGRVVREAGRGIELLGAARQRAAEQIEAMGRTSGITRFRRFLQLLEVLVTAPSHERRALAPAGFLAAPDAGSLRAAEAGLAYITAHLAGRVRLSDAARAAALSESAFSKHFKAASGLTFSEMVCRLRVAHAQQLLTTTETPIAQICHLVGYENLSHFNRQFRRVTGTTPSGYRRRHGSWAPPAAPVPPLPVPQLRNGSTDVGNIRRG